MENLDKNELFAKQLINRAAYICSLSDNSEEIFMHEDGGLERVSSAMVLDAENASLMSAIENLDEDSRNAILESINRTSLIADIEIAANGGSYSCAAGNTKKACEYLVSIINSEEK